MNERNYDFSTLSERISAQTEAAMEFSNALVRIIEQTAAIRDKINDSNDLFKDELKTIAQKLQDFISEFNKTVIENKNQNNLINKDINSFTERLTEYDKKISDLIHDNDTVHTSLLNSVSDLIKLYQKTFDAISENQKHNQDKAIEHHSSNKSILDQLVKEINTQNVKFADFEKKVTKIEYMFYAISAISVILGILSALNIVHIQWLPK